MIGKVILCIPLVVYCVLQSLHLSEGAITIQFGANRTFWKGCILQKIPLFTSETNLSTPCNKCAMSRNKSLIVKRKGWPQRMYNCTDFCDRVTVCTHAHYYNGKDKGTYPLCYGCQNKKDENINFVSIMLEEICLESCRNCTIFTDLPRAFECAHHCRGRPTFCYPNKKIFTHRLCYQATRWYGCDMERVDANTTKTFSEKCKICATLAKKQEESYECAGECGGFPTYSSVNGRGPRTFYACKKQPKVTHADLFLYEIPKFLLKHVLYSNPANLYLREMVNQHELLSGTINKFIFTPFNMTILTYPRPPGFEDNRKI